MRILYIHNFYQRFGGEDQVFAAEADLLTAYGHEVKRYTLHNEQIKSMSPLAVAKTTLWNSEVYRELRLLAKDFQPNIAHFHNTFPLISPAAYYAIKDEGIPVVQTLHNYRLLCPSAMFIRDGRVCEDCLGKAIPIPAILHGCYQEDRAASAVVVSMLSLHRLRQTWTQQVDAYISLTEFAQKKLIEGGLPAKKVLVKPNFVHPDPGIGRGDGNYALFVGRLSAEKGVQTLLKAWELLDGKFPLKIVGSGPLASNINQVIEKIPEIDWLGQKPLNEIFTLMKRASFLIFPSEWYEGLPRTIIEAFSVGTPVIASNLGAMSSLITQGITGLHFQPGNPEDLVAKVEWARAHPKELVQMRQEARAEYEKKYTADKNYQRTMEIYWQVCHPH